MPVSYYDAPVNRAIVNGLRFKGVEVLTAQEDGLSEASGEEILKRATEPSKPLVTTDHDFLVLAAQYQKKEQPFSGIIFLLNPDFL